MKYGTYCLICNSFTCAHMESPINHRGQSRLSVTQVEILRLIAAGAPNKVIAYELGVSHGMAKTYVSRLLAKLHFTCRTQLAIWAVTHKVVECQK